MMESATRPICAHHLGDYDTEPWSASNRAMCNLLHRGISPSRLAEADRDPPIPDPSTYSMEVG